MFLVFVLKHVRPNETRMKYNRLTFTTHVFFDNVSLVYIKSKIHVSFVTTHVLPRIKHVFYQTHVC